MTLDQQNALGHRVSTIGDVDRVFVCVKSDEIIRQELVTQP
ncbi:hypothetical protein [Schaalia cardiffensis]|nr:hypothetical protein [Schaalia cardiffensis]